MVKLSIIVPIYNTAKYLTRCIDSIIGQTYKNLEILLIDDGSTDDSLKICNQYAHTDSRIKVIHKPNGGQSSARNLGIDSATGDYITFVDSDDFIDRRMYELMLAAITITPYDLGICGCNIIQDGQSVKHIQSTSRIHVLSVNQIWQEIFGKLNNAVWNKIYIRKKIGDQRFSINIAHGEDLLFNLEYLQKCNNAISIDAKLYNYVQRNNSVTSSSFTTHKLYEIESKDIAYEIIKKTYPQLLSTAVRYRFRARLNVLRSIYKSSLEEENKTTIGQIQDYFKANRTNDWRHLTNKDKFEYWLFTRFRPIYKVLISLNRL